MKKSIARNNNKEHLNKQSNLISVKKHSGGDDYDDDDDNDEDEDEDGDEEDEDNMKESNDASFRMLVERYSSTKNGKIYLKRRRRN